MGLFDLALILDRDGRIASIQWKNERLRRFYGAVWSQYCGSDPAQTLQIPPESQNGEFSWNDECFSFERFRAGDTVCFFLKRQDHREALLKAALESVKDGIQVYDKNADIVYLNRTSRALSGFSDEFPAEGRHLMDLYPDLDEEYSTVLTTLRTCQPVQYRFADYVSAEGTHLITLNTGYPVMHRGELLGTVIQDQDIEIIQKKWNIWRS